MRILGSLGIALLAGCSVLPAKVTQSPPRLHVKYEGALQGDPLKGLEPRPTDVKPEAAARAASQFLSALGLGATDWKSAYYCKAQKAPSERDWVISSSEFQVTVDAASGSPYAFDNVERNIYRSHPLTNVKVLRYPDEKSARLRLEDVGRNLGLPQNAKLTQFRYRRYSPSAEGLRGGFSCNFEVDGKIIASCSFDARDGAALDCSINRELARRLGKH